MAFAHTHSLTLYAHTLLTTKNAVPPFHHRLTLLFCHQVALEFDGVPERNRVCYRWTGVISELSLRPRLWQVCEQAFPNYFEGQPTPPNAFRYEEEWSEVEDDAETNEFYIISKMMYYIKCVHIEMSLNNIEC